jgi:predicted  nucleic acid-binding Zn-ribbon protein
MATAKNKAVEADYSMEEKIKALYDLQQIDSKIDEINKIKGELPLEVQDLEDEIAGLHTRIENINAEIEELNGLTRQRKREATEAKALIERYEEQQNNVRNNREFDALTKEIEFQKLEIELANKRLKEYAAATKVKKAQAEDAEAIVEDRKLDLTQKRSELDSIEEETAKDIESLKVQEAEAQKKLDTRMLTAYQRIRGNMHNGLAVVTVKRDACGGCFNRIPPQRQVDIRQNKKIIICEYCGRILVADPTAKAEE